MTGNKEEIGRDLLHQRMGSGKHLRDFDLARRAQIELRVEELFRSSLRREYSMRNKSLIDYEDALALAKQIAVSVSEGKLK